MRLERKVVMKGPAPGGHDRDLVFFLGVGWGAVGGFELRSDVI